MSTGGRDREGPGGAGARAPDATPSEDRVGQLRVQAAMRRRQTQKGEGEASQPSGGGRAAEGSELGASARAPLEKSFGQSFGDVRVHEDGVAEERGAQAVTYGTDIHMAQGRYQPESRAGQRLIAHELAHVVQQRGAEPMAQHSGAQPRLADQCLEREADRAAHRAIDGEPAGPLTRVSGLARPQHFESNEHKDIGDTAVPESPKGQPQGVELAPGYFVSYGDIVAMAGDFFESIDQLRGLAGNKGKGAGTREEVEYVRRVKIPNRDDLEGGFSPSAIHAVKQRYYDLAMRNKSHFVNPRAGDPGKSEKEKDAERELGPDKKPRGVNAGSSYQANHHSAIARALELGKAGQPIDEALAIEAFSNHYLTDSFSAGHLRTPRADAKAFWDAKVPMFFANFKGYVAEQIAKHIDTGLLTDELTRMTWPMNGTHAGVEQALANAGVGNVGFGDIISAALHDRDNAGGVFAKVDGKMVQLFGDGTIMDGGGNPLQKGASTKALAVKAVQVSVEDVRSAYAAGKSGQTADQAMQRFVDADGMFAAERLIPQVVPDADPAQTSKSLKWDFPTVDALLGDEEMKKALKLTGEEKADEFSKLGPKSPKMVKDAFDAAVVKGLRDDPTGFLSRVVNYVPDTGGGLFGHNTDDNANDYLAKARATPGGIASLSVEQKGKLIKDVTAGYTAGDEESAILEILGAKPGDAPALIAGEGWHRLWKTIDGEHCRSFVEQFGPAYWAGRSLDEKKQEIKFLSGGVTRDLAQETIVVILRTCSPSEVQKIDHDVGGMTGLSWDLNGKWNDEFKRMKRSE